jgi:hypothetical protein
VAHSEQNFAFGWFVLPQVGHTCPSGVAHSMQKRAPVSFWVPQLGQITPDRPCLRLGGGD